MLIVYVNYNSHVVWITCGKGKEGGKGEGGWTSSPNVLLCQIQRGCQRRRARLLRVGEISRLIFLLRQSRRDFPHCACFPLPSSSSSLGVHLITCFYLLVGGCFFAVNLSPVYLLIFFLVSCYNVGVCPAVNFL